MNSDDPVQDYIVRLKGRYSRDNSVLDLIYLLEMMRAENKTLQDRLVETYRR